MGGKWKPGQKARGWKPRKLKGLRRPRRPLPGADKEKDMD